jgi:hypothetical protein
METVMGLASLIQNYRKRKSIGLYLSRLGPALTQLYGKSKYYKPEQVKKAAQEAKLPMADLCYGLTIYCTPEDFAEYHTASGEECSYWEMRVEVAEHHFHGNSAFTPQDVVAHSEAHSHVGHSHAGSDFGGHHEGDGSGHHGGHF